MRPVKIFLDETNCKESLFPFTEIRHAADLVVGKLSIRERWKKYAPDVIIFEENTEDCLTLPANIIPTAENIDTLINAAKLKILFVDSTLIPVLNHPFEVFYGFKKLLEEDIYSELGAVEEVGKSLWKEIQPMVFAHPSAILDSVLFDTQNGPILIDKDVKISIGAMLAGPIYIGEKSVIKMGAMLFGPLSIGKQCTIGGEVSNSIFYPYSNKSHYGYIGTSIIGSWCNMGAGTSCSNVKNTAGSISYEMPNAMTYQTNSIKAGLMMGDYSRTAINTSFNTAAVVGVSCNIFGGLDNRKFFRNFTWGAVEYELEKAVEHLDNWKRMKGQEITKEEIDLIKNLYNKTK